MVLVTSVTFDQSTVMVVVAHVEGTALTAATRRVTKQRRKAFILMAHSVSRRLKYDESYQRGAALLQCRSD